MIRSTKVALKFSNKNKLLKLKIVIRKFKEIVNSYINILWEQPALHKEKWIPKEIQKAVETDLSAVLQQKAGATALQNIRSQINNKKKEKIKPFYDSNTIELDQRSVVFLEKESSFDEFIKFKCLGMRIVLSCPIKFHAHYLKYSDWKRKNSVRILSRKGHLYLEVIFEKESELKKTDKFIGIDLGINKLMTDSDGKKYGTKISSLINKINRKLQGSKGFQRALREKNEYINKTVKELPEANYVIENLKKLKYKSKSRGLGKGFRKKLQYWNYRKALTRVQNFSEVVGVQCLKVSPSHTSQTCPVCGNINKLNRDREIFKCLNCGYQNDADVVGGINIRNRGTSQGVYGTLRDKEVSSANRFD